MRFWCKDCKKDLILRETYNENVWIQSFDRDFNFKGMVKGSGQEWFEARCPSCKRRVIRYITNKIQDPFYYLSKYAIIEREKYRKDLIQYGQEGFQLYYKDQWLKMEKAREDYEKRQIQEKKSRDAYYNKFKHNINQREAVKKALAIEEQL